MVTLARFPPFLTFLIGPISAPYFPILPIAFGMPRLVPESVILSRGTLARRCPLLTRPMRVTLSPNPTTALLEPGALRPVLQPAGLSRGILTRSSPLLTLRMSATSFLGLLTTLPVCGTHFHILPSDLPLILNFLQSPTWMVGSATQRVAYYTGYPTTVVQLCIHLLF